VTGVIDSRAGIPIRSFATPAQWEQWLTAEHATASALWLKIAKKGSPEATISYAQALRCALCFGWIDGQKAAFDEHFWLQRFTPRKARSRWSKINRDAAIELIEAGVMRPAGLEQVQAAKDDGRWEDAYEGQREAAVPEDLKRALQENEAARVFFERLKGANRYAIIYRIGEAKRPDTRVRRIERYVAMLARGETIHG
jgi:uncharacterized protein YdeI (YjbR/CyaY-like superfamily)